MITLSLSLALSLSLSHPPVLTEHQLFDVFNNAIVSLYRSEDEGRGVDGGGGGVAGGAPGSDSASSRSDRGSSGGGAASSIEGGGSTGGGGGSANNSPASGGGGGLAAVSAAPAPGAVTTNDALLFHEKCGTLIKLSNSNKTAERRRPLDEFNNGVVMTNLPLRHNEMFEVRPDACPVSFALF